MVTLLTKLFIKDADNVQNAGVRRALGSLCGALGIFLNVLLFAGKYAAGTISGSIAITADAFNNLSDAGSSLVTLLGFRFAGRAPDKDHPFGHGRIEYLTGLAVAVAILVMGIELGKASIEKILSPEPVETGVLSAVILVCAIGVKIYMYAYNRRVGRKIDSPAMSAVALDSLSDAAATAVVLLSMLFTRLTNIVIDGWSGALVALFILWSGYRAAREALSPLLGQRPDDEFVQAVEAIVLAHPEITGMHDLLVHDYGPGRRMISLHAEVSPKGELQVLHHAVDAAERELGEKLGCEAVIHMDPVAAGGEAAASCSRLTYSLQEMGVPCSIHDFQLWEHAGQTDVSFDLSVAADCPMGDGEIRAAAEAAARTLYPRCSLRITVDRDFTQEDDGAKGE